MDDAAARDSQTGMHTKQTLSRLTDRLLIFTTGA